jgi:hypothetical protein
MTGASSRVLAAESSHERAPRRSGSRVTTMMLAATVIGFVTLLIVYLTDARQALASYLFAFCCVFTVVVGALMLVMISQITGARWFAPLRPLALRISGALPALAALSLPLLLNVQTIYAWATPELLSPDARVLVSRKLAWLNVPFFISRAALYLAVWIVVAELLRRAPPRHLARLSAVGLIAVSMTFTFAAFDWVMSLDPTWFSTIYGVYIFSGGFLAALALVTVCREISWRRARQFDVAVHNERTVPLATLLLTFSMFWLYIAFSQYLIVWIADVPAEVTWYLRRTSGHWKYVPLVLVAGQFAIPFLCLLPYSLKRKSSVVAGVAAWLLLMHVLECYWLVMPAFHEGNLHVHYADVAALLFIGGLTAIVALKRRLIETTGGPTRVLTVTAS